jgi:fused signal recognition particle receptor
MGFFDRFKSKAGGAESEHAGAPSAAPEPREAAPAEPAARPSPAVAAPEGLLSRFKRGLKRTAQLLNTDIRDLFKQEGRLVDDDFARDLFALLIRTDMGTGPANAICERVLADHRARVVSMEEILQSIRAKLLELLAQPEEPIQFAAAGPTVIMVVGVNGSGKTTSIAKLARLFRDQGKRVVLGAGDTFRAAAVEQLTVWAERVGAQLVKGDAGGDPASIAHRAVALAVDSGAEVCIVDTAGRLQTQANLMNQLSKIRRVMGKLIPEAPHEVLLVLDATAGQNGLSQATGFSDAAGCTGIVLAKLDGTAKGGVIIPIRQQFNIPVKYVGIGESAEDLALFNPEEFVHALFAESESPPR